ncbi:methylenetetrahydrofolate reductase [Rhizoctonia solani 123E]|uniref:Methylenetetrahydrofolate reductase n=1 Tax=Rhizoctonia solani 123E TaxID=1423351 RepID=A0A074SVJ8_9AGAM|nr:methylenetetrahydrofolate reductase [Rhizoctonia solani 123E]
MKLTEKLATYRSDTPYFTFEFFPPRTDQGYSNLLTRISGLASLKPVATSVTWGAGGSTRDRSLDLAGFCQADNDLDTILHLTCTNMEKGTIDEALMTAMERGVSTVLALRGDPPRGEEYWIPTDPRFQHAEDLVTYIKQHPTFASHFCVGVAGYPDGHSEGGSEEEQLTHLKRKVDAGAEFIITQLFYDVEKFKSWLRKVRSTGITVPVIPGVMPLQTYATFTRMTDLCKATVPLHIQANLDAIKHDDQLVKEYGVSLAVSMIRSILVDGDVKGVHFCTLNLEKSVRKILDELGWTHESLHHNQIIIDANQSPHILPSPADAPHPTTFTISPSEAAQHANTSLAEHTRTGTLRTAAEAIDSGWDDFPNGRFGDSKSPAFGLIDPWDGGGLGVPPHVAIAQWGRPTTEQELSDLFLAYLNDTTSTTPFSPEPLSDESATILPHLVSLTKKGLWTVASQPAVDGALSSDPVIGWGPRDGRVFQKSFVEFFATEADLEKVAQAIEDSGDGWLTFFAGNNEDGFLTNIPDSGSNAVTWGVFPGKEIAQPTIIDRDSFLAWKDDAFMIWHDFGLCYPPDSPTRKLLEDVINTRWLVNIIHHDYKNSNALWDFLAKYLE